MTKSKQNDIHPLDPDNWESYRALAHRMVDESLDYLRDIRERRPWTKMPDDVRAAISNEPLPRAPQGDEKAYEDFLSLVRDYPNGNIHPRFWGWVMGTGSPQTAMADFLSSVMNPNVGGFDQSPRLVEKQVIGWCRELMGFPESAGGVLVSGGTMANLYALVVARQQRAGWDVRAKGSHGGPALRVYGSTETHSWLKKACEVVGLGNEAFRRVPVDSEFRVDVKAMAAMIAEDRAAGLMPFCIVGTSGTVQTGTSDDFDALAELAAKEGVWFHVDGAFGAMAALSKGEKAQAAVRGMDRADSVAFDLHKWGYMPFDIAVVLVREDRALTETFATQAAYLASESRGLLSTAGIYFSDRGIELSRSFKALKAWMMLKAQGTDRLGAHIERNIQQAAYLESRVARESELELLAPVPLNLVNFRFRVDGPNTDAVNKEILVRLQEDGIAVPSGTTINGKFAIRVAITNHRSDNSDFDALVDAVLRLGKELTA